MAGADNPNAGERGYLHNLKYEEMQDLKRFRAAFCNQDNSQWGTVMWGIDITVEDEQSDCILLKWLRATDFDIEKSLERLNDTLMWRADNNVENILAFELPPAMRNHDHHVGYDNFGRPILVTHFGSMDIEKVFGNLDLFVKYRVAMMERCVRRLLPFGRGKPETVFQVHDYSGTSVIYQDSKVKKGVEMISKILGDHYPEFKGTTIFANFPSILVGMINMFSVFVPEKTKKKMQFVSAGNVQAACLKYVTPTQLMEKLGGLQDPLKENELGLIQVSQKLAIPEAITKHEIITADGPDQKLVLKFRGCDDDYVKIKKIEFTTGDQTWDITAGALERPAGEAFKSGDYCYGTQKMTYVAPKAGCVSITFENDNWISTKRLIIGAGKFPIKNRGPNSGLTSGGPQSRAQSRGADSRYTQVSEQDE